MRCGAARSLTLAAAATLAAPAATRPAPAWTAVGPMAAARYAHAAVLLTDGSVLVAGGWGTGNFLASAETYDPTARAFAPTGPLFSARAFPSAMLLSTGRVLVAGGAAFLSQVEPLSTAEVYDPAARAWSATGTLGVARYMAAAAMLRSGKVLMAGGRGAGIPGKLSFTTPRVTEQYDPSAGTWSSSASTVSLGRYLATATSLPSGDVLLVSGYSNVSDAGPFSERYHPATDAWVPTAPALTGIVDFATALLPSGKVLLAGGMDANYAILAGAWLYDPAGETWTPTGPLAVPRKLYTLTLLPSGRVLAAGGLTGSLATATATSELYDPGAGTWSPGPPMAAARSEHTATLLRSGRVLVTGGKDLSSSFLATAEEFDEGPSTPIPAPSLGSAPASVAAGGALALGGAGFTGAPEGSSGAWQAAPTNFPLVRLTPQGGGPATCAPVSAFDDVSLVARVPAGLAPGGYDVSVVVSAAASAPAPLEVVPELAVEPPSAVVLAGAAVPFAVSGGSGPPYAWSLAADASGATLDAATGAYAAGTASSPGGVLDVVQVADALGHTSTAAVTVLAPVGIAPAAVELQAGAGQYFTPSGGSGAGWAWSLAANASGGAIGPLSGAYVAGPAAGVDVVRVTDSLGNAATATVSVTAAPPPGRPGRLGCGAGEGGWGALLVVPVLSGARWLRRRSGGGAHALP